MLVIFLRTFIIFTTLLIVMRFMGKRQIGEMQPFEFIVTLIIADLACIPMADVSIPLIYGIVSIVCLFLLHQLLSLLEQSGNIIKKVISGSPSIVIDKNGVNLSELKKNNLGIDDLIESMRSAGYFTFDDLSYAIYESNGKLSALENADKEKPTNSIPFLIINDGKINKHNLSLLNIPESYLFSFITERKISVKNIEILTIDTDGRVYLKEKKKKFEILKINITEKILC